jgi:hypothetical protein
MGSHATGGSTLQRPPDEVVNTSLSSTTSSGSLAVPEDTGPTTVTTAVQASGDKDYKRRRAGIGTLFAPRQANV